MNDKLIGIISYLPDNQEIRNKRLNKLLSLLNSCQEIFNLPILIIAQNYTENELKRIQFSNNVLIYESKEKLGIVGARNTLRREFLKSEFNYLIMLDDDCILVGNKDFGNTYKNQIDSNPNMYYEFNKSLLKLFAISKEIYKEIDFDTSINPEDGTGFEDRYFYNKLLKLYPDRHYKFISTGLGCHSFSSNDVNSTWYKNQNLKDMLENTFKLINNIN